MLNIKQICQKFETQPAEAAYRWLAYHSYLDSQMGDGPPRSSELLALVSWSRIFHILKKGPLAESVVDEFDKAWDLVKADSPPYFKFFTGN